MPSFRSLVLLHGYAFVFCYVLAVQSGAPLPSDPVLLIMGASIGDGRYSFLGTVCLVVFAALLGDALWYELGRWRGRSVLALLCRFSLEPDTCVRNAEASYQKRGAWSLLVVKFIPGLSLVSVPMAGAMKMPRWCFLLTDAAGTAVWATTYLALGVLFRRQIDTLISALGLYGRRAGTVIVLLLMLYLAWRLLQRWRFRWQLRVNRITPTEAHVIMSGANPATIVDLRSTAEVEATGLKIQGAHVMRPDELRAYFRNFPAGHEVILYCT